MNKSAYRSLAILVSAGMFLLASCVKDDSLDKQPVNEWIHETMAKNYYWNDEIRPLNQTNTSAKVDDYFYSLLSIKDGKNTDTGEHYYYSSIEEDVTTKSGSTNTTHGFIPDYRYLERDPSTIYARIKYVLANSPAEKAGLKRGEWISQYNGIQLTSSNYLEFHNYTGRMTLTVGDLTNNGFVNTKNVEIDAAISMAENPIFADTTYLINNRKIGYLMYNSFTSGPDGDDDKTFDNELRSVFTKFAGQNPDEFVLDLRYNGGGLLSCAQLLATMLAPQSALGKNFCKLTYNKTLNRTSEYTFDRNIINNGGANLNLNRLYVITSPETASSSELIINGLRPYMDVILIGEQTEGKNVGSNEFSGKSKGYSWILHPITCLVENSEGFSDYADGFKPTFEVSYTEFDYELGNTKEYMLSRALTVIETGALPASLRSADTGSETKALPLPHKGPRAVIVK